MTPLHHLKNMPIKRRDMGLAGAIIILSQLISNFQSSQVVTEEFKKFKQDFQQGQIDQEKYFVRKTELKSVVIKLDRMNDLIISLNEQIKSLRAEYLSSKSTTYSDASDDNQDDIIGCGFYKPAYRTRKPGWRL